MVRQAIDDVDLSGLAFDIGTQFNTGYRGIKMGAVISNFGPDLASQAEEGAHYEDGMTGTLTVVAS